MKSKQTPKPAPRLRIRELNSQADWQALYPLVRQLNPTLSEKEYRARLEGMLAGGYRCAGAFRGKRLAGACGLWINTKFYCGKYIELDNVVVNESERNGGIGLQLVRWAEQLGKKEGCQMIALDSYVHNAASHRFYFREGYGILGFHFTKTL